MALLDQKTSLNEEVSNPQVPAKLWHCYPDLLWSVGIIWSGATGAWSAGFFWQVPGYTCGSSTLMVYPILVDSSQNATGMILSQIDEQGRKRPARYGSVPMSEWEFRYSQPKLELFGLYHALWHWRLHIIGVKNLRVEVDFKYIKGMLNERDLQSNAAINRWIQGILLFDFTLVHVPADKHKGPDALSCWALAEGETAEPNDDSWLDNITLLTHFPALHNDPFTATPCESTYDPTTLPSCFSAQITQEDMLSQIHHFLDTLETPHL